MNCYIHTHTTPELGKYDDVCTPTSMFDNEANLLSHKLVPLPHMEVLDQQDVGNAARALTSPNIAEVRFSLSKWLASKSFSKDPWYEHYNVA